MNRDRVGVIHDSVPNRSQHLTDGGFGKLLRLRQFPESGEPRRIGRTLPHQNPVTVLDDEDRLFLQNRFRLTQLHWEFVLPSRSAAFARLADRA